jgi:hypothetical protein
MPAKLATAADPRFVRGAYITNGQELYRITGTLEEPAQLPWGSPVVLLEAENCKTEWPVKLDVAGVRRNCTLVKAAPSDTCPDAYEA